MSIVVLTTSLRPVFIQSLEFLKKVWKLYANTFSRPRRKVWKVEVKSGKMEISLARFLLKAAILTAKLNLCQLAEFDLNVISAKILSVLGV